MLSHRIIGASAVLLAVTIGSAAAQQQASAGKPLQLLQFARHEAKAPLHRRARTVEKLAKHAEVKRHVANKIVAKHRKMFAAIHAHAVHPHKIAEAAPAPAPEPAQPTSAAPPAAVWPAVNAATPAAVAMPDPPAAPQNVTPEQVLSDAPNDIAANGQVAQTAAAPEPNVPDAAPKQHAAAAEAAQAPAPAPSAAPEPVVRAMVATPEPAQSGATDQVGSASWMMQVLAALGGAVAAGVVAWFLVLRRRSEPQGEDFSAETLVPGE
jgi:hypothetical protein